jgi:hypothetical protein
MYVKGMRIELFQDLYTRYSNLQLSFEADRPIAIRGLERRLINILNTSGGFGVFNIFLHRCLLWQRAGRCMERIVTFRGGHVPSWSWMAYKGGIKYMEVPYVTVDWARDIETPFDEDGANASEKVTATKLELKGPYHHFVDSADAEVTLDEPNYKLEKPFGCIIIGTNKRTYDEEDLLCYVLVVAVIGGDDTSRSYQRVGVAKLRRSQVSSHASSMVVTVQ